MGKFYTSLGLMSGTSIDGIDASIIKSNGKDEYKIILDKYFKYDNKIRENILRVRSKLFTKEDLNINKNEIKNVEREINLHHASAVNNLIKANNINIDFIGFHGQTILHDSKNRISKQIGDGNLLAQLCKKNVIYDFRQNDIKNGGQGAPLTPIFHNVMVNKNLKKKFNDYKSINILNIGGIANITKIVKYNKFENSINKIKAADISPGNCLIDEWVRNNSKKQFDKNGKIAENGKTDLLILNQAIENFNISSPYRRSLDISEFDTNFVRGLNLENGTSTLSDFTAFFISKGLNFFSKNEDSLWMVCGGGRKNNYLMSAIKKQLYLINSKKINLYPIEKFNIDGDFIESRAFAYLAIRSYLNLPISFPETTGCMSPTVGGHKILKF